MHGEFVQTQAHKEFLQIQGELTLTSVCSIKNKLKMNICLSTVYDVNDWQNVFPIKVVAFMIGCKEFVLWSLEKRKIKMAHLLVILWTYCGIPFCGRINL